MRQDDPNFRAILRERMTAEAVELVRQLTASQSFDWQRVLLTFTTLLSAYESYAASGGTFTSAELENVVSDHEALLRVRGWMLHAHRTYDFVEIAEGRDD